MIPVSQFPDVPDTPSEQPSYTYRVNPFTKRIQGHIDGLDAIHQAVMKLLQTERFAFVIYDDQYGFEFESLVGQDRDYVKTAIGQRITEAITADDRIISVDSITITDRGNDALDISFTITTIYGALSIDMEVQT